MVSGKATDVLEREHKVILKVVAEMFVLVDDLENDRLIEPNLLQDLLKFMRIFMDKCHHQKEEACLFPLLENKGVPLRGCPLAVLLAEHSRGRALAMEFEVASNAYIADSHNKDALIKVLKNMADLYPSHIWKENYMLLPMADKLLSSPEQESLCADFERLESLLGPDVHAGFERFAARFDTLAPIEARP